ncbi:MAG: hypothetical protein ACRD28_06175 [Acidobacteriaceae bacterium]
MKNKTKALTPTKSQLAEEQKLDSMILHIPDATGIKNRDIADRIVCQVGESLLSSSPHTADSRLIKAIGTLREVGPRNGTEAMLSAQMIAAHEAAIHFTKLGAAQTRLEAIEVCARQAARFMRVFNEQLEAMQKLKGKTGQQKVTVEHVHVNEGGQAIVGALIAPRGEG